MKNSAIFILVAIAVIFGGLYFRENRKAHNAEDTISDLQGSVTDLLVLSQVVLALQLPFAMFPLLHFTSSSKRMGEWRNGWVLLVCGWTSAVLITSMDLFGLRESLKAAWRIITGG